VVRSRQVRRWWCCSWNTSTSLRSSAPSSPLSRANSSASAFCFPRRNVLFANNLAAWIRASRVFCAHTSTNRRQMFRYSSNTRYVGIISTNKLREAATREQRKFARLTWYSQDNVVIWVTKVSRKSETRWSVVDFYYLQLTHQTRRPGPCRLFAMTRSQAVAMIADRTVSQQTIQ